MKRLAFCLPFLIAACAPPFSTGGAGQMADGRPVAGTLTVDQMNGNNSAQISSPEGWKCTSNFGKNSNPGSMMRTVPLTCSNGATGNLLLTGNQMQDQVVGSFTLSNGKSGQVTFGRL